MLDKYDETEYNNLVRLAKDAIWAQHFFESMEHIPFGVVRSAKLIARHHERELAQWLLQRGPKD